MQHKLNCIGCLHTPISPVSHGHRAALSGARSAVRGTCVGTCVRACVGGKRRVWHAYRAFVCGKNWHWEGYRYPSFATRIDGDNRQKYHPPLSRSRARFRLFPFAPRMPRLSRDSQRYLRKKSRLLTRYERIDG